MFFIFGMSTKEKELDFSQTTICPSCGAYGRLEAFMTYSYFSLFFIPILKWNRKYYIKSSCCGSLYAIDEELGRGIEAGRINKVDESDLHPINVNHRRRRICSNCNYITDEDFEYCPRCGNRLS